MTNISLKQKINDDRLEQILKDIFLDPSMDLKKILILPPDLTRMHSAAGKITAVIYKLLKNDCVVDIMPALGTHEVMTKTEFMHMFGPDVPYERMIGHNWKTDIIKIGEIPSDYIKEVSEGLLDYSIDVEINRKLLDKSYDLIISVGQVVPHEVVGMANYSKNVFIGCGGKGIINKSHMLGAVCGMEKAMGQDHSPVRKVFDYAEKEFISKIPLMYILTVTTAVRDDVTIEGLFLGRSRELFEEAVKLSQEKNITKLDVPPIKMVVYLDEREFKSTWLGNKSIYRTRMAIADGGELIVLAPGVKKFGEDEKIDSLIRKYGYRGIKTILKFCDENQELRDNLSAAAHLIHGSSEGRFTITYATKLLSQAEVEGVSYKYMDYAEAIKKYDPEKLKDGYNKTLDGEEVYFIRNPAIGLWK